MTGCPSPSNGPGVGPTCHVTNSGVVLGSDDRVRVTKRPLGPVNLGGPAKRRMVVAAVSFVVPAQIDSSHRALLGQGSRFLIVQSSSNMLGLAPRFWLLFRPVARALVAYLHGE